jgi:hypothetical protein
MKIRPARCHTSGQALLATCYLLASLMLPSCACLQCYAQLHLATRPNHRAE